MLGADSARERIALAEAQDVECLGTVLELIERARRSRQSENTLIEVIINRQGHLQVRRIEHHTHYNSER